MAINFNPYIQINVKTLGSGIKRPDAKRNYTLFNETRVNILLKNPDESIPLLKDYLASSSDENGILEALSVLDKISDTSPEKVKPLYPYLSKFNDSNSPDIQVMLSGIYRKTLPPDAFGPLLKMLHKQITSPVSKFFDPTEETGGAVLEYLRAYGAVNLYSGSGLLLK